MPLDEECMIIHRSSAFRFRLGLMAIPLFCVLRTVCAFSAFNVFGSSAHVISVAGIHIMVLKTMMSQITDFIL
jgi:hypothetical protein